MNVPSISIAIPTFHRPADAISAIRSALAQTWPACEILVHDNSENDETERAVAGLSASAVRYLRHPRNLGQTGNWNSLLCAGRGDYVKFLNDDDLLQSDCLEKMGQGLIRQVGIATCRAAYFDPAHPLVDLKDDRVTGSGSNYRIDAGDVAGLWLADALPLRTPSHSLYHRETALAVGCFGDDHPYARDVFFGLRLAAANGAMFVEGKTLIRYAVHPGQVAKHIPLRTRLDDLQAVKSWAYQRADARSRQQTLEASLAAVGLREVALMLRAARWTDVATGLRELLAHPGLLPGAARRLIERDLLGTRHWRSFEAKRHYLPHP
ncbi:MAG: glycosyltransferase [Stagnimonas sp.]|nr:glycosyltransferase [Stagnimonas sp.]